MKILYFKCSAGISGDMIVGALLNLGFKKEFLIKELDKLKLGNYQIKIKKVEKKGLKALKFDVITAKEHKYRNLNDIYRIIDGSSLHGNIKLLSKKIFYNLAEAEAKIHKTTITKIHFHEVGAIDSIIDIVAASILINKLKVDQIYCSRISVGSGKVKFVHGTTKLPVPAVRKLLEGIPLQILNINKELTTPTGAAIIKTIVNDFVENFTIKVNKKGFGSGKRDLNIPNVLEAIIGEVNILYENKVVLETNIDDMNPEIYQHAIERLIRAGALDAFIKPIIMKKDIIGSLLTVICNEDKKDKMIEIIFKETTTFGIRINKISRIELKREIKKINTKYGILNIKIGRFKGKIMTVKPEYEDCKRIALSKKIPLRKVYDEVKFFKI